MGGPVDEGDLLIDPERLAARARLRGVSVPEVVDEVASTQDLVRDWADAGRPSGLSLVALRQTAGRGRLGRVWEAPAGSSLALSVLLRPALPAHRLGLLPLAAAVAVRAACGGVVRIKWPNDLLAPDGRKVAGLLAEADIARGAVRHVVLGVGINVTAAPPDLPAACLADLGPAPDLADLAVDVVAEVLSWTARLGRSPDLILDAWTAGSATVGARVAVAGHVGVAEGVAPDGALWLRKDDGERVRVLAGDVTSVAVREDEG